jgi:adenine/guanine phosphoribosyltransferase-like PRPP-binding protein
MEIVQEKDFRETFIKALDAAPKADYVVGPGRSGAVAAVYASHHLGIPFVPFNSRMEGKKALVVDTAVMSGKTLRKASRRYGNAPVVFAYDQSKIGHRLKFWYEELSITRGRGDEYKTLNG